MEKIKNKLNTVKLHGSFQLPNVEFSRILYLFSRYKARGSSQLPEKGKAGPEGPAQKLH